MKKIYSVIILCNLALFSFAQTKDETISYLNNVLQLHTNNSVYHSIMKMPDNTLSIDAKISFGNYFSTQRQIFDPKKALYISSTTNSVGVTTIIISFSPGSVKILVHDNISEYADKIIMESLIDVSTTDVEKIKKAFKHLIKLFGGQIKDDPF